MDQGANNRTQSVAPFPHSIVWRRPSRRDSSANAANKLFPATCWHASIPLGQDPGAISSNPGVPSSGPGALSTRPGDVSTRPGASPKCLLRPPVRSSRSQYPAHPRSLAAPLPECRASVRRPPFLTPKILAPTFLTPLPRSSPVLPKRSRPSPRRTHRMPRGLPLTPSAFFTG